jgi:hypothetical protein
MISLLIGMGALFLAVFASAILDPRPSRADEVDCWPRLPAPSSSPPPTATAEWALTT